MRASVCRYLIAAALLALLAPAGASAQGKPIPPGNSAINEYLESIPTATGGQSTTGIDRSHHSHSRSSRAGGQTGAGGAGGGAGSSGGGGGSSGGGGAGTGAGSGSETGSSSPAGSVSSSTYRALSAQGPVGATDAAFARATAPASGAGNRAAPGASPISPTAAVLKSLTGSSSNGGLGPLLPAILVLVALAAGLFALLRRRTGRATP